MGDSDASIDWQILTEIDQVDPGDPPASLEIYQSFRAHGLQRFERMSRAFEASDWATLDRESHALKSSSSCIGATKIQHMCEVVRDLVRSSRTLEIEKELSKINEEIMKVIQVMDEHFANLKTKHRR